jgi:hypothetical protein
VVPAFPDFEGFAERSVRANPCLDEFAGGGEYFSYAVTYYFGESVRNSDERRAANVSAAEEFWEDRGYLTERGEHEPSGAFWVDAETDEGLTLTVRTGGSRESNPPAVAARTGCVKGVEDPPCLDPQGGVPPKFDEVSGIRCPSA